MRITKVKCPGCGPKLAKKFAMTAAASAQVAARAKARAVSLCEKAGQPGHLAKYCLDCKVGA